MDHPPLTCAVCGMGYSRTDQQWKASGLMASAMTHGHHSVMCYLSKKRQFTGPLSEKSKIKIKVNSKICSCQKMAREIPFILGDR